MDSPAGKRSFASLSLSQATLGSLEAKGYESPTPVQEESIPKALAGKDLVVQSRTGTGKTAAFGIPMIEYVDPTTGGPVFKTMTFFAQMLRPGERTQPLQQTASLLVAPFEGSGHSVIGGQQIAWEQFDTLAVPGGEWCEHANDSDGEPAILFVASDEPALKAFNFYKKWGRTPGGDTVRIV